MERKQFSSDEKKLIADVVNTEGFKLLMEWIKDEKYACYTTHKQALSNPDYNICVKDLIVSAAKMEFIDKLDIKIQNIVKEVQEMK